MKQKLTNIFSIAILSVVLSVSTGIALANWSAPTAVPPGNNTPPSINVGTATQTKNGNLFLGAGKTIGATFGLFGQVGVGTISPTQTLDVNGNVNVRGTSIYMANSGTNFYGDGSNTAVRQSGDFYVQNLAASANRNIIANDVYLSGVGRWASAAGAEADTLATVVGRGNSAGVNWIQAGGYSDGNNGNYSLDPDGVSILNDVRPRITYDLDDTAYYSDPSYWSRFNAVNTNYQCLNGD